MGRTRRARGRLSPHRRPIRDPRLTATTALVLHHSAHTRSAAPVAPSAVRPALACAACRARGAPPLPRHMQRVATTHAGTLGSDGGLGTVLRRAFAWRTTATPATPATARPAALPAIMATTRGVSSVDTGAPASVVTVGADSTLTERPASARVVVSACADESMPPELESEAASASAAPASTAMVAPTRVEASVKVSATALVCTRAPAARTVWIVLRACASYDSGAPERTKEMTRVAEGDPVMGVEGGGAGTGGDAGAGDGRGEDGGGGCGTGDGGGESGEGGGVGAGDGDGGDGDGDSGDGGDGEGDSGDGGSGGRGGLGRAGGGGDSRGPTRTRIFWPLAQCEPALQKK